MRARKQTSVPTGSLSSWKILLSSLGCVGGQSALVLVRPLSNEVLLEAILLPSMLDRAEPLGSSTPLSFIIETRLLWWLRGVECGEAERCTLANALEGELEREADED